MSDVKKFDTKQTTIGGKIDETDRPAKLDVSLMTLKWAFELKGEGRISFPSPKQIVTRILRALN
ncbi:MAG: hypothetical protein ACREDJ_00525 [Methylocella sp.]